jgi:hypothetical protein
MFRRALRLGARVSVASCAAVVPATSACLSDSKSQRIEINAMEKNKRLLDRTELFDEISKLPPKAFLRRFVEDASDRVVGVENRLEPHRTQSTRRLHQAVLECLATNDSTYKFKPSVALKRHQSLNDLDVQDDDVAIADDTEQVPAASKADPAENAVAVAVN